jgi:UDP-hydrolysing UDP-N-acetyl-D-glucosamine 2-epimerase
MKTILFVTGSRADYGLLRELMILVNADPQFKSHIIVTGAHLSSLHGQSVNIVEKDDLGIIHRVDLEITSDSPAEISQAIGKGIIKSTEVLNQIRPDLIVLLGDRYELWSVAIPASILNIPLCHLHGGESTEGAIDEVIRHSLTKMSHLHFCSHEKYRERIIKMGEPPHRVFNVGALGIDRIARMKFLSNEEISIRIGTSLGKMNVLCTFHPVTTDKTVSDSETDQFFLALESYVKKNVGVKIFVSLPNADMFSNYIREKWHTLRPLYPENIFLFANLGDELYLSLMNASQVVIGNSSSGVLEAPYFKKGVIDIGNRQKGRLTSEHVIHVKATLNEILTALEKLADAETQKKLSILPSIYGEGGSSLQIFNQLKKTDFKSLVVKPFYDA